MDNETKEVLLTPDKDVLTGHRNNFQKQLIETVLDLKRHERIKKEDPTYQRQNTQTGKYTGINEMIENYRKAAVNAKAYVEIIDELLAIDEQGILQTAWEDIHKIPSPINEIATDEKEAEAEEEKPEEDLSVVEEAKE